MTSPPVVVVLAAGSGARFRREGLAPGHKLAQPFAGTTVLGSTLANVRRSGLPLVVVTSPALQSLASIDVAAQDIVVLDADGQPGPQAPRPGMGRSIAAGVCARPQACGWLVLPGDMPMVRPASLLAVAAALREHAIAQAQYGSRRGHPVGFCAGLRAGLARLEGDEGARALLRRHGSHAVEVDDEGVLLDLDEAGHLHALNALHATRQREAQKGKG